MIQEYLVRHIESINDARDYLDGWIHVSNLYDPCAREIGIRRRLKIKPQQKIAVSDRLLWESGTAYHNTLRGYLAKMGMLLGHWSCRRCDWASSEVLPHACPRSCNRCGKQDFRYREVTMRDEKRKIIGNGDCWISESRKLVPTEIKSMGISGFTNMRAVLAKHAFQVMMYREMAANLGWPVANYGIVLCAPLGFSMSPFKEYRVERDQDAVDRAYIRAEEIRNSAKGKLPERICGSILEPRAKACIVAKDCFDWKSRK